MSKHKRTPKGSMVLTSVDFSFQDSADFESLATVRFVHEEKGRHGVVMVFIGDNTAPDYQINNRNGRYKPCATHAAEILGTLTHKPPRTNFAKQRLEASTPELKVVG